MRWLKAICIVIVAVPAAVRLEASPAATRDTVNTVSFHAGIQEGDYRLSMGPARRVDGGVSGSGGAMLGSWHLSGDFGYRRQLRHGVYFSGVADPYQGNPYVWGDSLSGNWRDDIVESGAGLQTPWLGRHRLTAQVAYGTSLGVRTSDPKPLYRLRDAQVAIEYRIALSGGEYELHFRPSFRHVFEENEIGYGSGNNSFVIRSRGFGSSVEGPVVSMDRRRSGRYWHAELGISRPDRWYFITGLSLGDEMVTEGIADPAPDGSYRVFDVSARGAYRIGLFEPSASFGLTKGTGESFLSRSVDGHYTYYPIQNAFRDRIQAVASLAYGMPGDRWGPLAVSLALEDERWEDAIQGSLYRYTSLRSGAQVSLPAGILNLQLGAGYRYGLAGVAENGLPSRLGDAVFRHDNGYYRGNAVEWDARLRVPLFRTGAGRGNLFWLALAHRGAAAYLGIRTTSTVAVGIDFGRSP